MEWQNIAMIIVVLGGITPLAGCTDSRQEVAEPAPIPSAPVAPPSATPTSPSSTPAFPPPDYFREAVNRATSAVVIGQSAQSEADWQLAVGRWQQAVDLMERVPPQSPNYAQAQTKMQEYRRNLATAQQQAQGRPQPSAPATPAPLPNGLVAEIPIQERRGGTPVVEVTFQGQRGRQSFPMLFDTGATGTLITPAMADQIGVMIVGSTQVKIADGSTVELPIGYVDALEVGGLRKTSMTVAIGGSVGLLGQDVYGEYGIAMGSHVINLHH